MLAIGKQIRFRIRDILAKHWDEFFVQCKEWIRPVVLETVRKMLACRTPVLGCHHYRCPCCGHEETVPHSCKSRFCPTCGVAATDAWADGVLNGLLDVPYHHLVLSPPRETWAVIGQNREAGLNLLAAAANEAIAQWARDVHGMRMGIITVIHTFGSDLRWHPHIHLIVTGGGLSLDGKRWIETDPKYLMNHAGLKKRWKYQVVTRMKKAHREKKFRLWGKLEKLREYKFFAGMLNRLWPLTWYAHIGAGLLDPEHSVRYAGRYTKRAVLAEYRITYYDGKTVRYAYKDYAHGGKTSYKTLKVVNFIKRLVQHIPDKGFPMVRHTGLFCNRWKKRYMSQARKALGQRVRPRKKKSNWRKRQIAYRGKDPLKCEDCEKELKLVGIVFGKWKEVAKVFERSGRDASIPLLDYRQQQPAPT